MPQQQLYRYDIEYNGYRFSVDAYNQPSQEEVHGLWVDAVANKTDTTQGLPGIDVGFAETDYDRAERNSNEIGSMEPDRAYRDATFWQRFWDSAKLSAVPHFGTMESQYTPADESSELWAEALGGLGGAVAGMLPFSFLTGGVGVAAGGANLVRKYNQFSKLVKLAKAAKKRGRTDLADKIMDRAEHFARQNDEIFASAIVSKQLPQVSGILGKTAPYRERILKLAEKNPKHARALNLFANNVGTFALYGQTKLPYDKLEGRLEQLGMDTASSVVFSVAGLPTMLGYASKGVKYGVEPGALLGAGMYSDLGQTDMSLEERLIHGASLVGFHYARQGLGKLHLKEKIGTALRLANPKLSEARLNSVMDTKGMDNVITASLKEALKYPTYSDRRNPDRKVQLIRVEAPVEGKTEKHRGLVQELDTGEVFAVTGDSRPDVMRNINKKFSKNISPLRERITGKNLTPEEKVELTRLKAQENIMRDAMVSSRDKEVYELPQSSVTETIKTPFERTTGLADVNHWSGRVSRLQNDIVNLKETYKQQLSEGKINPNYLKNKYNKDITSAEGRLRDAELKLEQARQKVSVDKGDFVVQPAGNFEVGEIVKIPKYDSTLGKLDYTKAGVGKYIGQLGQFRNKKDIIMPEWMKREPKKYGNYFRDIPVFEIKTHGGSRTARVAIGGKIPKKVYEAIVKANEADRPLLEYAENNPRFKELAENPIIRTEYIGREPVSRYNPKNPIFKELFTDTPRGGAKELKSVIVEETSTRGPSSSELSQSVKETGFKDTRKYTYIKGKGKFAIQSKDVMGNTAAENFRNTARDVSFYQRSWEENVASFYGAKTKNPWMTANFKRIHEDAVKSGYKGSVKELWDGFKSGGRYNRIVFDKIPVTKEKEYFFYAPSRLKKIELPARYSETEGKMVKSGEKAFPEGEATPELIQRYQREKMESIAESLQVKREKERQEFSQFQGARVENWPDMNKMDRKALIDKEIYDSYPELNPQNDAPWAVNFKWDSRKGSKITTITRRGMKDGKVATFKTREEAERFANDYWINSESVESIITNLSRKISNLEGPEKRLFEQQRGALKKAQREQGIPDEEYRYLLSEWFPESRGSSKNMTFEEAQVATALLSNEGNTKVYQDKMSSMVPPVSMASNTKSKWQRLKMGAAKAALPVYTTLQMARSRIASMWGRNMINHELTRQLITGDFSQFKISLMKGFNLKGIKGKKQFDNISTIIDKKYSDWYNPKLMDKLPTEEIIKTYTAFRNKVLAEYLIPSGVEVRDASTRNAKYEPLFESYDRNGKRIELANGYDAIRLVEGIEFLDSNGNLTRPKNAETAKMVDGKVVNVETDAFPFEYVKSLRKLDKDTGKFDGGWYIEGNNRYVFEWKDRNTVKTIMLGKGTVENKNFKSASDKYVKVHNKDGESGKFNHHIEKNFLSRIITDEFREMMAFNKQFREGMAWVVASTDPQFKNLKATPLEKLEAAKRYLNNVDKFWRDQAGVFGTQYTRIANLPPIIALEANTNKIISLKGFKDINGNPVSKKSTVIDAKGERKSVGKVINVYERSFDKIISRYGQKVAHIAPTFQFFGKGGAESEKILKERDRLALETDESFAGWAHESLALQLNAVQKNKWYDSAIRNLTMTTAQIGLSSPFSGYKNFLLGQQSNATVFGFRLAANGMYNALADRKAMSTLTGRIGGKEAGVHELMTGRIVYSKYNPGMMRITEVMNRIISTSIGEPALRTHIDNLNGIKNIMNRGVSENTSMRTLTDVFKFTDAEIASMKKLGSHRLAERPDYIQRAQQMAHLITQGGPSLPFVPQWMGKNWSKPLTLFYRVAYRMTENVANSVIKPLVADGNPVPLVRYASLLPISGAAIFHAHYAAFDEEQRNQFKASGDKYFELALKAEGLASFSNAFDDYGNVVESYKPAVYRTVESLVKNLFATLTRKKFIDQSLKDLASENVVLFNRLIKLWEKSNRPLKKSLNDSRRRQRQFTDVYFRDKPFLGGELSTLTTKSPYYRAVKEVFWSDNEEEKARVYYAARNYIAQHEINKDPSLKKIPHKAKKLARTNLKTVVSAQRPIPSSWRKRTTGAKTRYEIYMSKLDPKSRKDEMYIENEYTKQLRAWNAAISKYGSKYDLDPFPGPSR